MSDIVICVRVCQQLACARISVYRREAEILYVVGTAGFISKIFQSVKPYHAIVEIIDHRRPYSSPTQALYLVESKLSAHPSVKKSFYRE